LDNNTVNTFKGKRTRYHSKTAACPYEHLQSSDVAKLEHAPSAPAGGTL